MGNRILRLLQIFCLVSVFGTHQAFSQEGDFLDILYAAPEDASRYIDGYLEPIFKGAGYGINNGWYNTAKTHKTLGFDLTFSVNLAYVPDADNYFTVNNSDYQVVQLANTNESETPTAFGPNEAGPEMVASVQDPVSGQSFEASFIGLKGAGLKDEIGFNAVPSPVLQLGIGIIKNTDIKIRYVPDVAREDVDYSIWGVGIMHDWGQWIPVINQLPIDFAIFGAYSKMNADISIEPSNIFPGNNQSVSTSISGYTIEALVSKKIAVLTVLGGIGYNSAKTNFDLLGSYNVTYENPALPTDLTLTYEDPIRIDTKEGSARLTAGLRLQLAVVTLHGTYTFNGYNLLNVGFGFSFR